MEYRGVGKKEGGMEGGRVVQITSAPATHVAVVALPPNMPSMAMLGSMKIAMRVLCWNLLYRKKMVPSGIFSGGSYLHTYMGVKLCSMQLLSSHTTSTFPLPFRGFLLLLHGREKVCVSVCV